MSQSAPQYRNPFQTIPLATACMSPPQPSTYIADPESSSYVADTLLNIEEPGVIVNIKTKDLKAMGLAAGGKVSKSSGHRFYTVYT